MRVLYLFGPNLGALGRRAPALYGAQTLEEIMAGVESRAAEMGHAIAWEQHDGEGELVTTLLDAGRAGLDAVVLNPGALSHYSIALRDAVEACGLPVIEVHMTNIHAREPFRRESLVSPVCRAIIVGLGTGGYHLALEALAWISPDGENG